jgi:sorbitol-specific phosphotransferase system component IIA/flagellin-specific chaperone FliS
MRFLETVRFLSVTGLSTAIATMTLVWSYPSIAQAQSLDSPEDLAQPTDDLRPLAQDSSILSIEGGQRLMSDAAAAVADQDYDSAVESLQQARQVFNQLSNFYQQLATSFSGIDLQITDEHRTLALQSAQLRDEATYQLALVHRAQNQPELAIPLLIQIVRSQQPTRELGQDAYQQLFELGFVSSAYPSDSADGEEAPAEEMSPPSSGSNVLSISGGQSLMSDAASAVSNQDYDTAEQRLQDARQVFNQLSNFYQQLATSFSGIDNQITDEQRSLALQSAQLRDESTYQLALVYRAQNKPEVSVPLLIQIVQSQQPTRELGQRAYQQLFELGFVNSPYPRNPDRQGETILSPGS